MKLIQLPDSKISNSEANNRKKTLFLEDFKFAVKFISKKNILLMLLIANTLYFVGSTVIDTYEVIFLTKELNISEQHYSFIVSFSGIAFIVAGFFNMYIGSKKISKLILFICGIGLSGISYIVFSFAQNVVFIYIALTILAFSYTTFKTSFNTIFQSNVNIENQGRVYSYLNAIQKLACAITILLSNFLLNIYSIRSIFIVFSLISTLGFLFSMPLFKREYYKNPDKKMY